MKKSPADPETPFPPLPSRLRIGAVDFDVELRSMLHAAAHMRRGEFSAEEQTIWVQEQFASSHCAAQTVVHEVLHALFYVQGIEQGDSEERIVGALARGLVQVFRDNPGLVPWLVEAVRGNAR